MVTAMRDAGPGANDARPVVIGALAELRDGAVQKANDRGIGLAQRFPALASWHRALLGSHLERLRALDGWQEFLGKR